MSCLRTTTQVTSIHEINSIVMQKLFKAYAYTFFLFASHSNPILIFLFHSIVLQSYCDFILILFSVFNSVFIRILFKFYLHYVLILIKFYLRHALQNVYQRACRLLRACTALHKPPATRRSAHIRTASRAPKRVPAHFVVCFRMCSALRNVYLHACFFWCASNVLRAPQ